MSLRWSKGETMWKRMIFLLSHYFPKMIPQTCLGRSQKKKMSRMMRPLYKNFVFVSVSDVKKVVRSRIRNSKNLVHHQFLLQLLCLVGRRRRLRPRLRNRLLVVNHLFHCHVLLPVNPVVLGVHVLGRHVVLRYGNRHPR